MEVRLHGDVSQDQPQCNRAVPGAPQPGQEEEHEPQHRRQALREAVPCRETEGQMQRDVKPNAGEEGEARGGGARWRGGYKEREVEKEERRKERLTEESNRNLIIYILLRLTGAFTDSAVILKSYRISAHMHVHSAKGEAAHREDEEGRRGTSRNLKTRVRAGCR